jgi:hypothetical protein
MNLPPSLGLFRLSRKRLLAAGSLVAASVLSAVEPASGQTSGGDPTGGPSSPANFGGGARPPLRSSSKLLLNQRGPGAWLSDDSFELTDGYNAIVVECIPIGANPLASFDVQDAAFPRGYFSNAVDPNGSTGPVSQATKFAVAGLRPFVKLFAQISAGVWTVVVTPINATYQVGASPTVMSTMDTGPTVTPTASGSVVPVFGQVTLTTASAPLPSVASHAATLQADPNNTDDVFVGDSSGQTWRLTPGGALSTIVSNLSSLQGKANSGTQNLNWLVV